jgi:hypothetical protein
MDRDYACPERKRTVLHAGTAYGAPAYLHTVGYRKMGSRSGDVLDHMVLDLDDTEDVPLIKSMRPRHEALLGKLRERLTFRYHPEDESITLNGEHLVKGIPAKILRNLLAIHIREGRCEFEYREFKRDFEISLGQKNSNFEVRFYRLMERLEEKCPSMTIGKSGRGRFVLKAECEVALEDGAI